MSKTREEVLEEEIERALAPWVGKLPADLIAMMREELALFALSHPVGLQLLERAVPPPVVDRSGDVSLAGVVESDAASGEKPR